MKNIISIIRNWVKDKSAAGDFIFCPPLFLIMYSVHQTANSFGGIGWSFKSEDTSETFSANLKFVSNHYLEVRCKAKLFITVF